MIPRQQLLRLFAGIVICLAFEGILTASAQQAATANLNGTVKDPNGALVAGAKVVLKHTDTGASREVTSNDHGAFVITNLAAGIYEVKVQATGFAERTVKDVDLQVGQTANLDIALAINVQETVILDDQFNYELLNTSNAVVD